MLWPVTLIGAAAGFAIASIPGTLLGALLGQAMDRQLRVQDWPDLLERLSGRSALRDDEVLFVLLGRLAKSSGRVVDGHIQQAQLEMRRLGLEGGSRKRAITAFNRGKAGRDRLRGHLLRLSRQPNTAEGLLRACWRMIWADGRATREERELIVQWGKWLGWGQVRVQGLSLEYEPQKAVPAGRGTHYQDALRLLGVAANTEPAQIKRAYRRLLSRHHPDKLTGNGATPAQVREATERTRDLHQAYALVRQRRDF
ncbi:DnaJ domain-containing protein [Pseudomonas sp. R5(2019)]|uniref:DnaJ domain-containing protein n=1 Tax=Pseudomonas sp. R5(2019) TaxID=2697566 RepID=UPI001412C1D5|nr:DnaJ domain-containing protein [Pseudomonas sp. R5(2019)]NBA97732.1 DnaJ domain-containing protein [Pseudomonas sp. R5(2019)]